MYQGTYRGTTILTGDNNLGGDRLLLRWPRSSSSQSEARVLPARNVLLENDAIVMYKHHVAPGRHEDVEYDYYW